MQRKLTSANCKLLPEIIKNTAPNFAYAYDVAWMAAVGFSQNPTDEIPEIDDSTVALPLWAQDLGSKQFTGLTGTRVLNNLFTDQVTFDYELQLSQFQSGKHEVSRHLLPRSTLSCRAWQQFSWHELVWRVT